MKQGYYWTTKKTGIASEIVWVTGRGKKYASVYRIGHKPPFAISEFKDFEFINDGYRKEGKVDEQTQSAFGPTPDEVVGCFLIEDDILK